MQYGKLENGYIQYAPTTVIWQGHIVNNPDATKLKELGYLPIKHVDMPQDAPEGQHYESSWEETETEIIQTWILVENEPIPEPKPTIEEQILALQNALISQKISGGGITTITDSSENHMKGFSLIGKSEQLTTTGKNLLDEGKIKNLSNYMKADITYYVYRLTGLSVGEKYTISRGNAKSGTNMLFGISVDQASYNNAKFMIYDGLNETFNNKYITWTQETGDYVDILFSYKSSSDQTTQEKLTELFQRILYVQLEKGSVATAYEPYTGKRPSPSPDYPQEIKNVGKYNETTGKYEVDVRISRKNLINSNIFEQGYLLSIDSGAKIEMVTSLTKSFTTSMDVRALQGKTISILVQTKEKAGKKYAFTDEANTIICGKWDTGNNDYSKFRNIQIPQNACKLYFSVTYDIQENTELQVELGNDVTSYEPYREPQTIKLSLDQPLRGIGDYTDKVTKDGIVRKIKRDTLDGSEYWEVETIRGDYTVFTVKIPDSTVMNGAHRTMMNISPYRKGVWNLAEFGHDMFASAIKLNLPKNKFQDADTLKQYLSEHPATIEYVLNNPIIEPLPEDFKRELEKIYSYYPTTVITVDGGELDPDVEVTYIADTKNYIDQKIDSVVKTVVETQKALL